MDSMPNLKDAPSLKDTPRGSLAAPLSPSDLTGAEDALAKLAEAAARTPQPRATATDFSAGLRAAAPPLTASHPLHSAAATRDGKTLAVDLREPIAEAREPRGGAARATLRFLLTAGLGVAATLLWQSAWQSYGDTARQLVADYVPLGFAAPAAPTADTGGEPIAVAAEADMPAPASAPAPTTAQAAPTLAAAASQPAPAPPPAAPEPTAEIAALTHDLAALRESVDKLAAGHDQMARTIAKLEAADEELRHKPAPRPAAPARRPLAAVPPPPQPAPQSLAPALPPPRPITPPASTARPAATPRPPVGLP